MPVKDSTALPDTSALPPLPPAPAPRAVIAPAKSVRSSDHTTTLPPSPAAPSADSRAPAATAVVFAFATLSLSVVLTAFLPPW